MSIVHEKKISEIKKEALRFLNRYKKLEAFALTEKEMKIVTEALKMGYDLTIIFNGEKMIIPIIKMNKGSF